MILLECPFIGQNIKSVNTLRLLDSINNACFTFYLSIKFTFYQYYTYLPLDQKIAYQTIPRTIMDWIELLSFQERYQSRQMTILRKWKKFTLYEHNSTVSFNEDEQTFTCIFNSKKINSQHSIIGKIHGNLRTSQVCITNTLTDHQLLMGGKWQYQKIQLTRFAFRYNQRSHNNILIKVNPINGQVAVCMSFVMTPGLFNDEHQFKEIMTDFCQVLGEEAEKIFNTMMEIIYQRESNEPYLKSGIKVNPNFPRYMKVEKLLDKVKSLIATSSYYKIRVDTSSAHKNRSYFKKLYLTNEKKFVKDEEIQKMALVYQPKYNRAYQENTRQKLREKPKQYIKDYTQLQEKNEVEFAKHLNQNQTFQEPAFVKLSISEVKDPVMERYEASDMKKVIMTSTKQAISVLVDNFSDGENVHTFQILNKLQANHPNIAKYYLDEKYPQVRITQGFNSLSLQQFLTRNKKTISLSTKFDIMSQLCHALQFMHKRTVGCFMRPSDIMIDENFKVKVRNLSYAYAVGDKTGWKEAKSATSELNQHVNLEIDYEQSHIEFPYVNITAGLQTDMRNDPKRGIQNQKCDIFSLGIVLYRILIDRYPFCIDSLLQQIAKMSVQQYNRSWRKLWTVQTEFYLSQGGQIVKLVAHLLLRCFNSLDLGSRPYVEWLTVILSQIKTSLNGLY